MTAFLGVHLNAGLLLKYGKKNTSSDEIATTSRCPHFCSKTAKIALNVAQL